MQNKYFKFLIIALALAVIVPQIALATWWNPFSWGWLNRIFHFQQNPVACTLEAKLCPDGTSVGREGPKCDFAECPKLIGGDKDAHGCLPAAGYTWCEVKQKCLRSWEEKCEKVVDPTVGWKTYNNDRYGYSIEYPNDWSASFSKSDFSVRGGGDIIGGDSVISKDNFIITMMIYKVDPDVTYDSFTKNYGVGTKENFTINGVGALKLTSISVDMPVGITVVNTFVKSGDKMFTFNYSGKPIPVVKKNFADQIISTFKFTK